MLYLCGRLAVYVRFSLWARSNHASSVPSLISASILASLHRECFYTLVPIVPGDLQSGIALREANWMVCDGETWFDSYFVVSRKAVF